jgi:NAD(P)-dependent dehydrogenase (short-subunit alcohol dehydrogenase family)
LGQAAAVDIAKAAGVPLDRVVFHLLDVESSSSVQHFATWLRKTYPGGVTGLINNAGVLFAGDSISREPGEGFGAHKVSALMHLNDAASC